MKKGVKYLKNRKRLSVSIKVEAKFKNCKNAHTAYKNIDSSASRGFLIISNIFDVFSTNIVDIKRNEDADNEYSPKYQSSRIISFQGKIHAQHKNKEAFRILSDIFLKIDESKKI